MREYLLYIKTGAEKMLSAQAYVTPCFAVDQSFWQEREGCQLHVIGKSPSLALAFSLREIVNARLEEQYGTSHPMSEEGLAELRELAVQQVRETAVLYGRDMAGVEPPGPEWFTWEIGDWSVSVTPEIMGDDGQKLKLRLATATIQKVLNGRALLWEEAETLLLKREAPIHDLTAVLQRMVLSERAQWRPGIRFAIKKSWWKHRLEMSCDRCGSRAKDIEYTVCHSCGQGCAYCTVCLGMGRSKCCTPYLLVPATREAASVKCEAGRKAAKLHWSGSFSRDQAVAAEQARRYVANHRPGLSQFLIWAVCGAGKTELLFPSIEAALSTGCRVLIATPRKDVVLELAPRLQRVFPDARVIAVHGSSLEKWEEADITIATTHQVMRYYQRFPLVVLDEVDAFPYHNNLVLERAVARAVKPEGKLLFLSATPPQYLQKRLVAERKEKLVLKRAKLPLLRSATHVLLPGRYHGSALPVPRIETIPGLHKRMRTNRPISPLLEIVRSTLAEGRQLFLFVPRIDDVERVLAYLTTFFPDLASQMAGVHAADPQRDEKVRSFREKRYRLMVTTTILERGVTIPRSDVVVLGAEAPVFDEASLVQIAGRVGRSSDDPTGVVLFLQAERAASPKAAVKQIKRMNQLAKLKGAQEERA